MWTCVGSVSVLWQWLVRLPCPQWCVRVRSGLVVTAVLFVGWVGSAVLVSVVVVGGGWVVVGSVAVGGASGCCTGDDVRGV